MVEKFKQLRAAFKREIGKSSINDIYAYNNWLERKLIETDLLDKDKQIADLRSILRISDTVRFPIPKPENHEKNN